MTIRNGFSRAMSTIIDSNLTTILTGIILYVVGTDQLRGFAVTLVLGLLISMFTAVFCARVFFDVAERQKWLKEIRMMSLIGQTKIDFMKLGVPAIIVSVVLVAIGLAASIKLGGYLLDTDLSGGTSVVMTTNEPILPDLVRTKLGPKLDEQKIQYTVTGINVNLQGTTQTVKIDSSFADVGDLQNVIRDTFLGDGGQSILKTYTANFSQPQLVTSVAESTPTTPENPPEPKSNGGKSNDAGKSPVEKDPASPVEKPPEVSSPVEKATETKVPPEKTVPEKAPEAKAPEAKATEKAEEEKPAEEKKPDAKPAESKSPDGDSSNPSDDKSTEPSKDGASCEVTKTEAAPASEAPPAEPKKSDESNVESKKVEAPADTSKKEEPQKDDVKADDAKKDDVKKDDVKKDDVKKDDAKSPESTKPESAADAKKDVTREAAETATISDPGAPKSTAPATVDASPADPSSASQATTVTDFTFSNPISFSQLKKQLLDAAKEQGIELSDIDQQSGDPQSKAPETKWTVRMPLDVEQATRVAEKLTAKVSGTPVWLSASKIGPQVAGDAKRRAAWALFASWIAITLYTWFRFQHFVYGIAAVVALIHDVLVTVAFIAMSHWVAGKLGFLLVDEFRISLSVVAALLTIIGYSINDTIVIFDRMREVKGKSPLITAEMINLSVNQTLGRTVLTFVACFLVVLVLYVYGGEGIHAFAFSLVVGTISGVYSTVFIASPMVLWIANRSNAKNVPGRKASAA